MAGAAAAVVDGTGYDWELKTAQFDDDYARLEMTTVWGPSAWSSSIRALASSIEVTGAPEVSCSTSNWVTDRACHEWVTAP